MASPLPCLSAALLLGACASAPPPTPPPPRPGPSCPAGAAAGAPVQLAVRLQAQVRGMVTPRNLLPKDRLRPDEQIALTAWTDRPVHLYVVQRGGAGLRRLRQAGDDGAWPAKEPLRVPAGERFLDVPTETPLAFYVVASQAPLWEAAPRLCRSLRLRCAPRPEGSRGDEEQQDPPETPDTEEPPPPPAGMDQTERWPPRVVDDRYVQVGTDACGVALLSWPITVER